MSHVSIKDKIFSKNLPGDIETPVSAFIKLRPMGARFLLESAQLGGTLGRYSFIGFGRSEITGYPQKTIVKEDGKITREIQGKDPLHALEALIAEQNTLPADRQIHILGAVVGNFSYETVRLVEDLPSNNNILSSECEMFHFIIVDRLVVIDHLSGIITVMSIDEDKGLDGVDEIANKLSEHLPQTSSEMHEEVKLASTIGQDEYGAMVERAVEYIREGDIFQVVLSRRYEGSFDGDPFSVYRKLRLLNPSPYMFYFEFSHKKIVGSSPEIHARLRGDKVFIAPIAGTKPRGCNTIEDDDLAKELKADGKENAEHIMLVDLARNDIGRVCQPGSIHVDRFMAVEKYSHVMHLVSDVTGTLKPECNAFDVLRATFPAGTVSGAPKVRAMEIIDEMEPVPRGGYAGAVGYITPSGDMDVCIAIRTMFFEQGKVFVQAGAGIVADSNPKKEYLETENKMAALFVSLRPDFEALEKVKDTNNDSSD